MLSTKDIVGYFSELYQHIHKAYCVDIQDQDYATAPKALSVTLEQVGIKAKATDSILRGVELILEENPNARIIIAGSLYLAGEFLKLNNKA